MRILLVSLDAEMHFDRRFCNEIWGFLDVFGIKQFLEKVAVVCNLPYLKTTVPAAKLLISNNLETNLNQFEGAL